MRLAKSTNKQDFMAFLVEVKQAVLPRFRSQLQILLYDGARAHTCRDSQEFMEGYFKALQIPVMSCEFNCKYSFRSLSNLFHSKAVKSNKLTQNTQLSRNSLNSFNFVKTKL